MSLFVVSKDPTAPSKVTLPVPPALIVNDCIVERALLPAANVLPKVISPLTVDIIIGVTVPLTAYPVSKITAPL